MELSLDPHILKAWGYLENEVLLHQIGSGHINSTYLVTPTENPERKKYILQKINHSVFKNPENIANNIKIVADYLKQNAPDYLFITPIPTLNGQEMAVIDGNYWRLMPYVPNAVAFDVLSDPKQAFEAAKQFGKLSRLLNNCDTKDLKPTIPGFHDLSLRIAQYDEALENAEPALKQQAEEYILQTQKHAHILSYYQSFAHSKNFPDRIIHHDTKISNVLLDEHTFEGICVIDLDTLMAGKFISDLGDMMRTYLCAFSENEVDISKIKIRLDYFEAMMNGYLSEMSKSLSSTEKDLILYAGKYIIYMQAVRFLTDFLNGNIYYPTAYPTQNLDRTANQFKLLTELYTHEKVLQDIIEKSLKTYK